MSKEEETTLIYGIEMPNLDDDVQPLECIVLVKGIIMETGAPTITCMGSSGITPWEAVGMLETESNRLKMSYVFSSSSFRKDNGNDE